jgi:hypothetical protein
LALYNVSLTKSPAPELGGFAAANALQSPAVNVSGDFYARGDVFTIRAGSDEDGGADRFGGVGIEWPAIGIAVRRNRSRSLTRRAPFRELQVAELGLGIETHGDVRVEFVQAGVH